MKPKGYQLVTGDALNILKSMSDESAQCVVTSPPYWGLRDYGVDGQLGLESTIGEYVASMVEIFSEVKRVLKKNGTLWLNLGDSYSHSVPPKPGSSIDKSGLSNSRENHERRWANMSATKKEWGNLKPKDLIGIPWRLAFALQDDGWYLRSDIIWAKPNPMPESVRDRPTRSHEYIFLFAKSGKPTVWKARDTREWSNTPDFSQRILIDGEDHPRWLGYSYYYDADAIREPYTASTIERLDQRGFHAQPGGPKDSRSGNRSPRNTLENLKEKVDKQRGHGRRHSGFDDRWDEMSKEDQQSCGANKRTVWNLATRPFSEAHFATFPIEIPLTCIRAGTRHGDLVLDPFSGAGTTGVAACSLGREYIGIELNPEYNEMAERRIGDASRQGVLKGIDDI